MYTLTENNSVLAFWQQIKPYSGKVFGLIGGFILAGSYGAMLGLIFGNAIDKFIYGWILHPEWIRYREIGYEARRLYTQSLFQLMGYLAKADGRILHTDIHYARRIMREMRLYGREKLFAMHQYNAGRARDFDAHEALNAACRGFEHDSELRKLFLQTLHNACKRKLMTPETKQRLNLIYMRMGIKLPYPMYGSEKVVFHTTSHKTSDYDILGVSADASKEEVKAAFRKQIRRVHPDKQIARGASEEEIKEANEKTKRIHEAYRRIKEQRGF